MLVHTFVTMNLNHTSFPFVENASSNSANENCTEHNLFASCYEESSNGTNTDEFATIPNDIIQAMFCLLYSTIFVLGVFGNVLVCYVVFRNKAMQTVTNYFITNLALSDILLCTLSVPFTPLYSFLGQWIFGNVLCHLVAYAQGTSVYISTFTLMSIAIDRYCVIIYPFHPRMKLSTCFSIITGIWIFSLVATLPYGIYMSLTLLANDKYYCEEKWPTETLRQWFGSLTAIIQFVIPLFIIAFCYIKVSLKLKDRARAKPGTKNSKKEESDRERKRRTNRMLIAMVTIFAVSWLPLNVINFLNDFYPPVGSMKYYHLCFFFVHALAMSSTCYNPFLYAWLNENFRKEFKQVLPFFDNGSRNIAGTSVRTGGWKSERTCNGNNETMHDTLLASTVNRQGSVKLRDVSTSKTLLQGSLGDGGKIDDSVVDVETVLVPSATYAAEKETVLLHLTPGTGGGRRSPAGGDLMKNGEGYEVTDMKTPLQRDMANRV